MQTLPLRTIIVLVNRHGVRGHNERQHESESSESLHGVKDDGDESDSKCGSKTAKAQTICAALLLVCFCSGRCAN